MNAGKQELKIRRVSSRKRSRDSLQTHRTPARETGGGSCSLQRSKSRRLSSIMAQVQPAEYCSDSEDLFGDYDSILEDSSLLAKLDNAEQNERQRDLQSGLSKDSTWRRSCEDILTDSIIDGLGDEDLPASQIQFEEQVCDVKRSRLQDGDRTSTPFRNTAGTAEAGKDGNMEDKTKRQSKARRSVTDQLKRTMLCNAAAPSNVSRTAVLKEAVVSEEISVAMRAMETVSAETTDLGPFFGLPTKVKDLMHKLRRIKSLYGDESINRSVFMCQLIN